MVTNEQKQRVWQAYHDRKPIRVPVNLDTNVRVVLLDERFNPHGWTFQEYFSDAQVLAQVQLAWMDYKAEYLSQFCDVAAGRPTNFRLYTDVQNIYDAAYFGCPVNFRDGQVPDIEPILTGENKNRIFDFDIDHPLDNPFIKQCLARHEGLVREARKISIPGLEVKVAPFEMGWDGPLTIAVQLRGQEILTDMIEDPDYAVRLMEFIQRGAIIRTRALAALAGVDCFTGPGGGMADDSIAMISTDMYQELIMPLHRQWYDLYGPGPHGVHLCGDATRHFDTLHRELNVCSFDTGFPVNHGALRRELGDEVEIFGGVEVGILISGTADEVYQRAKGILQSGIMSGGRFILKEANNLPPCCPDANLAAMYKACLDHGNY